MGGRKRRSKRLSAGNPEQPPDPFVIFLDETSHNCKPIHVSLEQLSVKFVRHGSMFEPGVNDEDWLPVVGKEKWIVLTCDQRIRYNLLEREKILNHEIRQFVFTSGNLSGPGMGTILLKAIPLMRKLCAKTPAPFIATISKSGNVTVRWNKDGSIHDQTRRIVENDESGEQD